MSIHILRSFIAKVSVLGYLPYYVSYSIYTITITIVKLLIYIPTSNSIDIYSI